MVQTQRTLDEAVNGYTCYLRNWFIPSIFTIYLVTKSTAVKSVLILPSIIILPHSIRAPLRERTLPDPQTRIFLERLLPPSTQPCRYGTVTGNEPWETARKRSLGCARFGPSNSRGWASVLLPTHGRPQRAPARAPVREPLQKPLKARFWEPIPLQLRGPILGRVNAR